jgi:osmotically-inducible protein OsmY
VTSFNRQVLLTGEVPTAQDRQPSSRWCGGEQRALGGERSGRDAQHQLGQRSNDTFITGKVRASLVDAKDLSASAFKVVTERNVVYLMGR